MINDNQLNLSDDAITVIMEFLAKDKELTPDLLSLMSVDRRFRAIGQKNKIIESLDFGNLAQYRVGGNITSFINFIGKFTDLKYLRLPMWFTDQDLSQLKQQDNFARLKKLDLNGCYQLTNLPDSLPKSLEEIILEDCHGLTNAELQKLCNLPALKRIDGNDPQIL